MPCHYRLFDMQSTKKKLSLPPSVLCNTILTQDHKILQTRVGVLGDGMYWDLCYHTICLVYFQSHSKKKKEREKKKRENVEK